MTEVSSKVKWMAIQLSKRYKKMHDSKSFGVVSAYTDWAIIRDLLSLEGYNIEKDRAWKTVSKNPEVREYLDVS